MGRSGDRLLWYSYIYYSISIILFAYIFVHFTNTFRGSHYSNLDGKVILNVFLHFINYILLISIMSVYMIVTSYSNILCIFTDDISYIDYFFYNSLLFKNTINFSLIYIYVFPFIYIFLFITSLSVLYCLSYNVNELKSFMSYLLIISAAGYTLFFTDSLVIFFFSYEALLLPSFFILYNFAKTRKCVEAAYLMFFWTQFGALFLILGLLFLFNAANSTSFSQIEVINFNSFEINFVFLCLLVGFGVKLPIWPFYGWLPKAHVEASTNFSIFLSGVLVKFAFFGFLKCLLTLQLEPTFYPIYPFLVIGIFDSSFKLFYQVDLKKVVAYSTVVEMHWLTLCVVSGQSALLLGGFCMLIGHALLSTNSFLLVDAIGRRFKTRLITEISGLNFLCPKLFLVILTNLLVFLGFPGSLMFIAEIIFFTYLFDLFPTLFITLLPLLYLLVPTFFFKVWMNAIFGYSDRLNWAAPADLSSKELVTYVGLIVTMFWLGFTWQSFIF